MKRENISDIRRRLEPSAELKRRVTERAAKLEAGRKTFGNERTADNKQIFETKEKKENITMSINKTNNEMNTVRNHFPAAVLSVAACAALVIGIAAVGLRGGDNELIADKETITAPAAQSAPDSSAIEAPVINKPGVAPDDEPDPENIMTVTLIIDGEELPGEITDKDRIAAIDELIEKTQKSHVWEGEEVPTERKIEYTLNGKHHTVKIGEEQIGTQYHPNSNPHPEICRVVTVDGKSYVLCEFTPEEPLRELWWATGLTCDMFFQRWNDDDPDNSHSYEEILDRYAGEDLKAIIDDMRKNGTPQFETENLYYWDEEKLPSWDTARVDVNFLLDGNYYEVTLFRDSDLIYTEVYDWHDNKVRSEVYKDTQDWIARFDKIFVQLDNRQEGMPYYNDEISEQTYGDDTNKTEEPTVKKAPSGEKVKLPELYGLTEEQAAAALKEAGLNCLIGYSFDSYYDKGQVCMVTNTDYDFDRDGIDGYDYAGKGTYIAIEISLGEYDGPIEMVKPEHATGYYLTKKSKLEVPVPDGLSGSYTFNIYEYGETVSSETVNDAKDVKSVTLEAEASDGQWLAVYAVNNGSDEQELIRYATYEFDYVTETWTRVGSLNTEGLLGTMSR